MVKAAKPSQMGIYTAYVQTLNTVYFDNVQLFKEEFGHSYDYDHDDHQRGETCKEQAKYAVTDLTTIW